jgi:hypothetical protein
MNTCFLFMGFIYIYSWKFLCMIYIIYICKRVHTYIYVYVYVYIHIYIYMYMSIYSGYFVECSDQFKTVCGLKEDFKSQSIIDLVRPTTPEGAKYIIPYNPSY